MSEPQTIEGYAIVSANGMIADHNGVMPPSIRIEADQKFLQAEMDRAAVIVHGRHSYEGGPRANERKRLVVTRQITALAPDPAYPHAVLWNPLGATLAQALAEIRVAGGLIAILGGTDVFDLFLPQYNAFHLTHAPRAFIPDGRPVFREVGPGVTPDDVLARHKLHAGSPRNLDASAGVTMTTWRR